MAKIQTSRLLKTFVLIMLAYIGATTYYYVYELANRSQLIYTDNYRSLNYSFNLLRQLEQLESDTAIQYIGNQIKAQQTNITEQGEKNVTDSLQFYYDEMLSAQDISHKQTAISRLKQFSFQIIRLNSEAINKKIAFAQNYPQTALLWMLAQLFIGFLIGILFLFIYLRIRKSNQLNQLKTNFLANVSHELKTPIATIKLSLQLLANAKVGELNPSQRDLLAHIGDDTERLLSLTNELLNLSQSESGKISLNISQTQPSKLVDYALHTVDLSIKQKNLSISPQLEYGIVSIDEEKIAWVLINLLNNAIRYSPAGGKITIMGQREDTRFYRISVQDEGKGIATEFQDKIFERFFQIPTNSSDKGSAGVGLAISKEFMEAQGGKITVSSQLGQGATFSIWLPVAM